MTNREFEEQVKIQQEALRRESKRKAKKAADFALFAGALSGNKQISDLCKSIIQGRVYVYTALLAMLVGMIVGGLWHLPILFTIPCIAVCVWVHQMAKGTGVWFLAVILDVAVFAFWALMRFGVMPCCW